MNEPLITIIIAAKDAQKTIEKCLTSIFELDYKNYELIVVNDGSTDNTTKILDNYASKAKVFTNTKSLGPSAARNIAAGIAKGDYLAFTDADCLVDKDWLKELLKGFACPDTVSVGGVQEIPPDESAFGRRVSIFMKKTGFITDYMRKSKIGLVSVSHNPSCNVMYKKNTFLKDGGFLENLWPGEDVEFDYRLKKKGCNLAFNPRAIVYHYRPDNLKSFSRMMYRYGMAQGVLVKKYGIFRKIQIIPLLILAFLTMLVLSLFSNWLLTILAILLIFVLILVYFRFKFSDLGLAGFSFIFWNAGFLIGIIRIGIGINPLKNHLFYSRNILQL